MVKISQKQVRSKLSDCVFSSATDPIMKVVAEVGNAEYSCRRAIENLMTLDTENADETLRQTISILALARCQLDGSEKVSS